MLTLNAIFVFLLLNWLSLYSGTRGSNSRTHSPKICLSSTTTLAGLITCLDFFTVPPNFYSSSSYAAAQPTDIERKAWMAVVRSMLNTISAVSSTTDCAHISVPDALTDIYSITKFNDTSTNRIFCVLFEMTGITEVHSKNHSYAKGWGFMVVPASANDISRTIHISAPHPQADIGTPQQAAAIFALSGAHSLLVSGRFRSAYKAQTDCIIPASGKGTVYYKTDPTHDLDEPFSVANQEIREWQNANGGCPSETCAYVQIHGKSARSCAANTIFISSGLGTSLSSIAWYQNPALDIPARRLRDTARVVFKSSPPTSSWNISLPSDDPTCPLTATTNVFGRLLNGIPEKSVCNTEANSTTAGTGEFVHIEQSIIARQSPVYEQWGEVFRKTFQGSYKEGNVEDVKTGLCISS